MKTGSEWQIYRTRFLIKAKQLSEPLVFVDALGREHCGQKGDYLVESSDGTRRIAARAIFEDVYVAIAPADKKFLHGMRDAILVPAKMQELDNVQPNSV